MLAPFVVDNVDSELGQSVVLYVASLGLGFWCGRALSGWRNGSYAMIAAAFGVGILAALWVYLDARYPSAPFLYEAWGIRFGLAGGLVFLGGLLAGDMVERNSISPTAGLLASLASLAGAIVGLLRTLAEIG